MRIFLCRLSAVAAIAITTVVTTHVQASASVAHPFDATFGSDGMAVHQLPAQKSISSAVDVLSDANENLLAVFVANPGTNQAKATIGKYSRQGTPISSFGTNGRTDYVSLATPTVAVHSDGKILLAGYAYRNNKTFLEVHRFTTSGIIDTTFGVRGMYSLPSFPGKDFSGNEVLVTINDAAERIHLGFDVNNGQNTNINFYFITLDSQGDLDFSWGNSGSREIIPRSGSASAWSSLTSMALLSDGALLSIGATMGSGGARVLVLTKLTDNGFLDNTYDGANDANGMVLLQFDNQSDAYMTSVQVLDSDVVVVAGIAGTYFYGPMYYAMSRIQSDGQVDTTFGPTSNGFFLSALEAGWDSPLPKRIAVQSSGHFVFNINSGTTAGFMRVNSNGTVNGGTQCSHCLWTGTNSGAQATALTVQSDDKVIVTGTLRTEQNSIVRRFLSDGTSDSGFTNVVLEFSEEIWEAYLLKSEPQSDGSILSVGTAGVARGFDEVTGVLVMKFTSSGTLDTQFGNGGFKILFAPSNDFWLNPTNFVVQPDGKIVVVASGRSNNAKESILLWRIHSHGALDNTFGSNGFTITTDGQADLSPTSMVRLSSGKLVVGVTQHVNWEGTGWLYHYTDSGILDSSSTYFGNQAVYLSLIAAAGNDSVYIAGEATENSETRSFIARILPDGSFDPTFSGGVVSWPTGQQDSLDWFSDIYVESDGRINLLGNKSNPDRRIIMMQLLPNGVINTAFNGTGHLSIPVLESENLQYVVGSSLAPAHGGFTIVGGGDSDPRWSHSRYFSLAIRTTPSGALDTDFGNRGILLPLTNTESSFIDISPITNTSSLITGLLRENGIDKILLLKIGPTSQAPVPTQPPITSPPVTTPSATVPPITAPPATTVPVASSSANNDIALRITVNQAAVLRRLNMTVPRGAKVSMRSTTPRICQVVRSRIRATATGTCRVAVTMTDKKKKKTTKTLRLKVS